MSKTKKRLILIITVLVMLLGCTAAASAGTVKCGTCGDDITWTLDDKGVLTLSGTGETERYYFYGDSFPGWYRNAYDIKTVVIEDGITELSEELFEECKNIEEVHFPSTLYRWEYAFRYYNLEIKRLYIADLESYCKSREIEYSVNWPEDYADEGYNDYEYIWSLGSGATKLYVNGKLVEELIIPDGVTYVDGFSGISSIKKVIIPESVKLINSYAFQKCKNLGEVVISESVEEIEGSAFECCHKLKKVTIQGNPKVYGTSFRNCNLETVSAPNLTNISPIYVGGLITTSNHTTSSVKITWPKDPDGYIKKIEFNGVEIVPSKNKSYTIKNAEGRKFDGDYWVKFYYDDGISPSLQHYTDSVDYAYKPYKTYISKLTTGSKYVKIQWKENKSYDVDGYQIQIATNAKFTSGKKTYTVKDAEQLSKKITKLKKGKKYYVRVRAYAEETCVYYDELRDGCGEVLKTNYGKWSDVKSITCK